MDKKRLSEEKLQLLKKKLDAKLDAHNKLSNKESNDTSLSLQQKLLQLFKIHKKGQ